jgi:hypothetical protein
MVGDNSNNGIQKNLRLKNSIHQCTINSMHLGVNSLTRFPCMQPKNSKLLIESNQNTTKIAPRMLSMDCTCKNFHILPLAEHARKFVHRMLSTMKSVQRMLSM